MSQLPARRAPLPRRKTAARRPATKREGVRAYDVVLRGTYEVRMDAVRAAGRDAAIAHVERQLTDYARNACQGNNKIEVDKDTTEVKAHATKFVVELRIPAKDEDEARQKLQALGEDAFIETVDKEFTRRGY